MSLNINAELSKGLEALRALPVGGLPGADATALRDAGAHLAFGPAARPVLRRRLFEHLARCAAGRRGHGALLLHRRRRADPVGPSRRLVHHAHAGLRAQFSGAVPAPVRGAVSIAFAGDHRQRRVDRLACQPQERHHHRRRGDRRRRHRDARRGAFHHRGRRAGPGDPPALSDVLVERIRACPWWDWDLRALALDWQHPEQAQAMLEEAVADGRVSRWNPGWRLLDRGQPPAEGQPAPLVFLPG